MSTPRKVPGIENRRRARRDGSLYWTYRVRWTDHAGRRRSDEFDTQKDAIDFRAQLRLAKRAGQVAALDQGRETLAAFIEEWWNDWAKQNLEAKTRKTYATIWNRHGLRRIGHLELRHVTPRVVTQLRRDLEQAGVGAPTIRTLMAILQGVFARAVEWERAPANPVKSVRKPRARPSRAVEPLAPHTVEALRDQLGQRDATLVSVLAYAGVRPEEALALEWRHVRRTTILVEQKNVDGEIVTGQKTGRPPRTIDLLSPLRADLAAYKLASGRPGDRALVFPRPDGNPLREHDYRNWRRRTYRPAAERARVPDPGRPYALRHSFASLRIHEGMLSIAELAEQMGHSIQMLLGTYTHVIAELKGQPKLPADVQIQRAREGRRKEAM